MPTVSDIISRKGSFVATVRPDSMVLEAAKIMNARKIGSLVVVDEDDQPVGMFTERDVLIRVVVRRANPEETLVREVMTAPIATCAMETRLDECKQMMTERRIRHIPVVDRHRIAGIVTSGDIAALEVSHGAETIEHLSNYIKQSQ